MLTKWYAAAQVAAFQVQQKIRQLLTKEDGETNIIAIIIILVIVIALAIAFRKNIADLFTTLWGKVTGGVNNGNFDASMN